MQISDDKKILQLVKSSTASKKRARGTVKGRNPVIGADEYGQQVEQYARRIRETSDVNEIINILDTVLGETRNLRYSNEVYSAQEQVRLAEKQIESLKLELEQLRELIGVAWMLFMCERRRVLTETRTHCVRLCLIWMTSSRSMIPMVISLVMMFWFIL